MLRDISAFLIANSTPVPGDTAVHRAAKPVCRPGGRSQLYGESFCASCHAVQNAAGNMVGGNVGPELTRVGSKVKPEWLQAWLRDPRLYDPNTAMPHYRFNDSQVATLSGFLLGQKTDSDLLANVHLEAATPSRSSTASAWSPITAAHPATKLRGSGSRRTSLPNSAASAASPSPNSFSYLACSTHLPDYIAGKIKQPRAFSPGLKMPQYTFTAAQIDALTTALLSLNERSATYCPRRSAWQRRRNRTISPPAKQED